MSLCRQAGPSGKPEGLSAALVVGSRELMKLESGHGGGARLQAEKGKRQSEGKGAYKMKGPPSALPKFRLPLIGA